MNISTLFDHIDSGHMALPEFQRGFVWNRDQVRALMDSLYRRHPVGSLLVWVTKSETAQHRGEGQLAAGTVKLLLDGQQRITSLYGITRGKPPRFFDGNATAFTGLWFHLDREDFAFYSPIKMKDDPLWIDVTALMKAGNDGIGALAGKFWTNPALAGKAPEYMGRLNRILGIRDIHLHEDEVTGEDKTIDMVVDIFNRVNSGGTKLSKGDLALAKVCAGWPEARTKMKAALSRWQKGGYRFDLDWFLRNVNTVLTGEAKFLHLHDIDAACFQNGLSRAEKTIDHVLNLISGRLGLDHDRVLFGRYAVPVMARYIDQKGGHLADAVERDRLLFWYLQCAMWGRFSGSTESYIDKDLELIANKVDGLTDLIDELRLWHGGLRVSPGHFKGWSVGARFYPVLYMLTRVREAMDWGTGLPLKASLLGKMNKLEVHHIFPKALLYRQGYKKSQVNAVANYCFQTKSTNLRIGAKSPEVYFPEIEANHAGALASQWVPMDPELWRIGNYLEFLEARRKLLAGAANAFLDELLHGEALPRAEGGPVDQETGSDVGLVQPVSVDVPGGVEGDEEEEQLLNLAQWVIDQSLPEGILLHELADPESGAHVAILDLAWPNGLQEGLSQPVAVLLNADLKTLQAASTHGFRHFASVDAFKEHVRCKLLANDAQETAA